VGRGWSIDISVSSGGDVWEGWSIDISLSMRELEETDRAGWLLGLPRGLFEVRSGAGLGSLSGFHRDDERVP
jgi:hypothetical protein